LSLEKINILNEVIRERLKNHIDFVEKRVLSNETNFKHFNAHYNFPVMTSQETELVFNYLESIEVIDNQIVVGYSTKPDTNFGYIQSPRNLGQQALTF
jgi:predicted glycosyl hydrolase (DUF1957 family)